MPASRTSAKQRKRKEKRFVRRTVFFSTVLMAVLTVFAFRYYKNRAAILEEKAKEAMAGGDFEKAEQLLNKLGTGAETGDPGAEQTAALLQESRYQNALQMMENGDLNGAEGLFSQLGDYLDSRSRIQECRYRAAAALESKGSYEEAADAYLALSGYADALYRYDICRYRMAGQLEKENRLQEAFSLYLALGAFEDSRDRAGAIASALTGVGDPDLAIRLAEGYSEEEISRIERLYAARSTLPGKVLAVGFYHTAGVTADGKAICCGKNDEGQCETSAWTNVKAIACGAYHTAGLRSDGTVVCCGRNSEGQCDTGSWTDVVEIVCTYYGTAGLKSDGTVYYCGNHPEEGPGSWQGITALGAGAYMTVGIRSGGTLLSTHPSTAAEALTGLIGADADTGYAVALSQDGTVYCTAGDPGWDACISVSAGSTGYLALSESGSVLARFFEERNALDFSDITDAVAIAAGGTHSAVLRRDGTVTVRGSNAFGECDTASWHLKTN